MGFRPICQYYSVPAHPRSQSRAGACWPELARDDADRSANFLDEPWRHGRIIIDTMARRRSPAPEDPKVAALRAAGALHPHPDVVADEAFRGHEFFDRRDRVQVKYEMLRRHRIDGRPVTEVASAFGVSRQAFYAAETVFTTAGLPGLLPRARGPKRAHKCTDEILDFVEQQRAVDPTRPAAAWAAAVQERFGIAIHPRSLTRALARRKKNRAPRIGRRRKPSRG